MTIRPLTDATALERLWPTQPLQPFLQSWAWGEFQRQYGRRIWRVGATENSQLVGAALVVEHQLALGKTYLYCPRGPIGADEKIIQALLGEIKNLGQEQGTMYIKVDLPNYDFAFGPEQFPADYSPGTTLQPRQTLVIDLTRPASELSAAMHQKTRYNIRLAEKRGVTVRWSTADNDFDKFLMLMRATAVRQNIRLHPDRYYHQLFHTLSRAGMTEICLAEHGEQLLAANLIIWHQQTATYLHGASSDEHKEMMAPHLLQWRSIQRAQERRFTRYDFWGVAPEESPQHRWQGITRFKKGFGGYVVKFPPAANAILQSTWYWSYRLAKRMRGGFDE